MDEPSPNELRPSTGATGKENCNEFSNWFVVETLPNKEPFALKNLERQNFRTFFPRFFRTRRHARKSETVLAPLFPGYLFVKPEGGASATSSVNGTLGVRRYVAGSSGRPATMPAAAMSKLIARCRDGIVHRLLEPEPGTRVRIVRGPLTDRLATIEQLDSRGRVHVLLEMMGRDVGISLDYASVGPV